MIRHRLSRDCAFVAHSRGLCTPCVRFAVHVTVAPRNTRYRLVANLCRAGLSPAELHREVSDHLFLLSQALPGAHHIHVVVEAEDRVALARAITGLNIRIARALNRLMKRKGQVIEDRYHVRALKTPTEVRNALRYLLLNARKHGLTTTELPDPYSSWANQDVVAKPHSWLLRRGFERAGPPAVAAPT